MTDTRKDIRTRNPQEQHRGAFLRGWNDAARDGRLYKTVLGMKTHANMGNLFGWIYGQQSLDFKLETWYRYRDAQARARVTVRRRS